MPIWFEPNRGQASPEILFLGRAAGLDILFLRDEIVLGSSHSNRTVRMKVFGANLLAEVAGVEEQPGKTNYLLGSDRSKWITGVSHFRKVRYRNVYPGIDLIFYGKQNRLEYDWIVSPGARLEKIKFTFDEQVGLRIDVSGNLLLESGKVGI